ncbi:MAG: hypothetical protein Q9221_008376 [Calogaya cf. arnoldii]
MAAPEPEKTATDPHPAPDLSAIEEQIRQLDRGWAVASERHKHNSRRAQDLLQETLQRIQVLQDFQNLLRGRHSVILQKPPLQEYSGITWGFAKTLKKVSCEIDGLLKLQQERISEVSSLEHELNLTAAAINRSLERQRQLATITTSLQNLISSFLNILTSIFNTFYSAIETVFATASSLIGSIVDLFSGFVGFVLGTSALLSLYTPNPLPAKEMGPRVKNKAKEDVSGNIVIIGLLVAAFVGYSAYQQKQGRNKKGMLKTS